ncbi:hypothetical protein BGW80DRAFT_1164696 [Lactifluus volemus]|nr:hypothetical protein BGW80DRAFT_1164696 [Lactifluus volemus]
MSEDPVGICCSIAVIACLDVYAGICVDFMSFRHSFTETMCKCRCCQRSEKVLALDEGERAPLIQHTQPAPSQSMIIDGS